jgi:hypothetical protein
MLLLSPEKIIDLDMKYFVGTGYSLFKPTIDPEVDLGISSDEYINEEVYATPLLTAYRVLENKINGKMTVVFLDTNIVIGMGELLTQLKRSVNPKKDLTKRKACLDEADKLFYQTYEFDKLIAFSRGTGVYLNPSHVTNETGCHANRNNDYFNEFIDTYMPEYDPQEYYSSRNDTYIKPSYGNATILHKREMMYHYLGMLHLQVIAKLYADMPPERKFEYFIERIEKSIQMMSSKQCIITMVCFSVLTDSDLYAKLGIIDEDEFEQFSKIRENIISNFLLKNGKKIKTSDDAISTAYNAANDIQLLQYASLIELSKKVKVESWVLTRDQKLSSLYEFYQYSAKLGRSGILELDVIVRESYFNTCKKMLHNYSIERMTFNKVNQIGDRHEYIELCRMGYEINRAEQDLISLYKK